MTAVLFDDLVHDAVAAAAVTPLDKTSVWEGGRIQTYTRVRVDTRIAGGIDDEVLVRTMGGTVDRTRQLVEGEAALTLGKKVLVFLRPLSASELPAWQVVARGQGELSIEEARDGTARVAAPSDLGLVLLPSDERVARVRQRRPQVAAKLARDALGGLSFDAAARAAPGGRARPRRCHRSSASACAGPWPSL